MLTEHGSSITSLAYSPDGSTLVTGGKDDTVRFWDAATGIERTVLTGHGSSITSLAYSPDGTILTVLAEGRVKLLDAATGQSQTTFSFDVTSVSYSPDGIILATLNTDGTVRLWDAATGKHKVTLIGHNNYAIRSIAYSPDGKTLAAASGACTVLWDLTQIIKSPRKFGGKSNKDSH